MPMPTFRRAGDIQTDTQPVAPTQPAPSAAPQGDNMYPGACTLCGVTVPAKQGKRSKQDGRWVVTHLPGGCDAPEAVAPAPEPEREVNIVNGEPLYDGIYTYETLTSYRTFRLHTQGTDLEFMPGVQIIQYLVGQNNDTDYVSIGHVAGGKPRIWKRHQDKQTLVADVMAFFADPQGALTAAQCFACHRTLTVPTSIHAGYGPECAKRVG